jgi:hypothetical protein
MVSAERKTTEDTEDMEIAATHRSLRSPHPPRFARRPLPAVRGEAWRDTASRGFQEHKAW